MGDRLEGLVIKTQSGFFTVQTSRGPVVCQLRGKLLAEKRNTDICAIGDRVGLELVAPATGVIHQVAPRQRVLSRVAPASVLGGRADEREQVIIANPDQAVFVFSVRQPEPRLRMLDRFLVAAEKAGVVSVICCNKVDLTGLPTAQAVFGLYERIGYPVLYVSAVQGLGVDELARLLTGKISVFTGPSGVGKTRLLNAIQPSLGRRVAEVSRATTKGRHTTVHAELTLLDAGGYVADTPGIRAISVWDIEPTELDAYYVEIHPHVANCQFSDCTHHHEPGCAVRVAVKRGEIHPGRYDSYLRLYDELDSQYVY